MSPHSDCVPLCWALGHTQMSCSTWPLPSWEGEAGCQQLLEQGCPGFLRSFLSGLMLSTGLLSGSEGRGWGQRSSRYCLGWDGNRLLQLGKGEHSPRPPECAE